MPEGPEIRLAADEIAKVIENQVIEDIDVGLPHLICSAKKLIGVKVEEVETRGKAMLIHFANGLSVYSHNQLYGVWKTGKRGLKLNVRFVSPYIQKPKALYFIALQILQYTSVMI